MQLYTPLVHPYVRMLLRLALLFIYLLLDFIIFEKNYSLKYLSYIYQYVQICLFSLGKLVGWSICQIQLKDYYILTNF